MAIREELDRARAHTYHLRQQVPDLEREERSLQEQTQALADKIARLAEQARHLHEQASRAERQASEHDRMANELRDALGPYWRDIAISRTVYDVEKRAVDELRELANRDAELREAPGQLAAIASRLEQIAIEIEYIPSEHRIAVELAEAVERQSKEALHQLELDHRAAEQDRDAMIDRRRQADDLEKTIEGLNRKVVAFGKLAEILKEHRPLQTKIASDE